MNIDPSKTYVMPLVMGPLGDRKDFGAVGMRMLSASGFGCTGRE